MEFIQPVQNNTSVYIILRSLLAVTSPSTEGLKLDFFMTRLNLMSFCSFVCRSAVLRKLIWYQMIRTYLFLCDGRWLIWTFKEAMGDEAKARQAKVIIQ